MKADIAVYVVDRRTQGINIDIAIYWVVYEYTAIQWNDDLTYLAIVA